MKATAVAKMLCHFLFIMKLWCDKFHQAINDGLFFFRPVSAPEEFSMAVHELPVADLDGADHRLCFALPGALRRLLHDDGLHQPSASHHL